MARSKKPGAPARNSNASRSGIDSQNPPVKVTVSVDAGLPDFAQYVSDLAAGAMWIAKSLANVKNLDLDEQKLIGLYAEVSAELTQVAAELLGEVGIKPAPLGNLSDEQYEQLTEKHAEALGLMLSQCMSAWKHLEAREEIREAISSADQTTPVLDMPVGLVLMEVDGVWFVNPVLNYLAARMRAVKRMVREMAANQAWRHRGEQNEGDLSERIRKVIGE